MVNKVKKISNETGEKVGAVTAKTINLKPVTEEGKDNNKVEQIPVVYHNATVPTIKVRFAREYKGCTGGVWYYFSAGQIAEIPVEIYDRLKTINGMLQLP